MMNESSYVVETKRWWILFAFSFTAMMQSMCWNILSPITDGIRAGFGVSLLSDSFISWSTNSANIAFLCAIGPLSWIADNKGPRFVTLLSGALLLVCCILRCIPVEGQAFQAVMVLAMIFDGLSGAWLNFGGPILSELWFPNSERTMATAAMAVATYFGGALGFVIGPQVVGDHTPFANSTATQPAARQAVQRLFYLEAGLTAAAFLCVCVCFPDQPIEPPSEAAAEKRKRGREREGPNASPHGGEKPLLQQEEEGQPAGASGSGELEFLEILLGYGPTVGGKEHLRTRFWVIALCMGLPLGVYQARGGLYCIPTIYVDGNTGGLYHYLTLGWTQVIT